MILCDICLIDFVVIRHNCLMHLRYAYDMQHLLYAATLLLYVNRRTHTRLAKSASIILLINLLIYFLSLGNDFAFNIALFFCIDIFHFFMLATKSFYLKFFN